MKFLDLAGISPNATPEYLAALDMDDATPVAPEHRLTLLKQLRDGAGVRVITGPEGAAFWLPVSVEVRIVIAPDGYEYPDRAEGLEWALRAQGLSERIAASLSARAAEGKEPTQRSAVYEKYQAAKALLAEYETYTEPVGSIIVEASHIEAVTDFAEQMALLDKVENVAMDFEWNIDPRYPLYEPEGMSIATADRTWYFPWWASDIEPPHFGYEAEIRTKVSGVIMRTPTVWHNAKADLGAQWPTAPLDAFGAPLHDTLVMAFVAGEHDLALKPLTRSLLGRDPLDFPGAMRELPLEVGRRYGGADSRNTYDLFNVLYQRLHARDQWAVYDEIERPIIPILVDMERYGHPVDMPSAVRFRDTLVEEENRLRSLFLPTYDISKDIEIRALVKQMTGYDPGTVKEAALSKIQGEWMDNVIRYRKVRHRRRAFLDKHVAKWEAAGCPEDFRLFTSFNQAGDSDPHETRGFRKAPRSGRLSSKSPDKLPLGAVNGAPGGNLQNQPNEGADGGFMEGVPGAKPIYVAPPGHVLWARDYKQLEIRIAAARSGDMNLRAAVLSVDGPHVDFQNRIFAMTGQRIAKVAAKQGNFNAQYGGHVDMLRTILQKQRVFMPDEDLAVVVETHKAAYPEYYTYGDQVTRFAEMNGGYSQTAFGRRRYDEDIFSHDQRAQMHAQRALLNHTIQGTAADVLKIGMKLIVPVLRYYGAHLALQVHDELEGFCPAENIEPFLADLDRVLAAVQLPGMTLELDGGYGRTWAEAH